MLEKLPAFLVFQSPVRSLPPQQLTDRTRHFRDCQPGVIARDIMHQLQLLAGEDAPPEAQASRNHPRSFSARSVTSPCHGCTGAGALSTAAGTAYRGTDSGGRDLSQGAGAPAVSGRGP